MQRLFSRSPALQLKEKCLLAHCDGSVTVRLFGVPPQPCHLQIRMFHSRHKFDAFCSSSSPLHRGFQSYSVGEALPCFKHFLQAQTQGAKSKCIKEYKRNGKIKPNTNSNGLAYRFSLGSQPLVAHFKVLEFIQLEYVL